MHSSMFKKGLLVGIIVLFVGVGVFPVTGFINNYDVVQHTKQFSLADIMAWGG